MHSLMTRGKLQGIVRRHFGQDVPGIYEMSKNVSFILQNGHPVLTYARPFLPNVAEIACVHCKPAKKLPEVSVNTHPFIELKKKWFSGPGAVYQRFGRAWFHLLQHGLFGEGQQLPRIL